MSSPSVYGVASNSVVAACWHNNGGQLTWMVRANTDSGIGYRFTRTETPATAWLAVQPTIGTSGKGLHLAELIVWQSALSSSHLADIQTYVSARWGVTFPVTTGTVVSLPAAVVLGPVRPDLPIVQYTPWTAQYDYFITQLNGFVTQWRNTNDDGIVLNPTIANRIVYTTRNGHPCLHVPSGCTLMASPNTQLAGCTISICLQFLLASTQRVFNVEEPLILQLPRI